MLRRRFAARTNGLSWLPFEKGYQFPTQEKELPMNAIDSVFLPAFRWVLESSLQASVVVLLILAVQGVLRGRLPVRWHYGLWLVLIVRLLAPVAPESPLSVFNALERGWDWATTPATSPEIAPVETNVTFTDWVLPSVVAYEPLPTHLPAANAPYWTTRHLVALGWVAGITVLLLLILQACVRYTRKVRDAAPITDPANLLLLEDCAQRMGVHPPPVYETLHVSSPVVFGTFRPRLFLPQGLAATLSNDALRYVFLHELAHIKRWDLPMNWLTAMLQAVHWFNPLLWYAFHRMRIDREFACDALVLQHTQPGQATDYGRTLVGLAERYTTTRSLPGLAGIVEGRSNLKRRIQRIATFRHDARTWSVLAIVAAALLTVVSLTDAQTEEPEDAASTEESALGDHAAPAATPPAEEVTISTPEILEKLKSPVNIEFEDVHIGEILSFFSSSYKVPITIDWRVVSRPGSESGGDRSADWVTPGIVPYLSLRKVSMADALITMLKPLGLTYAVRANDVFITSPAMLAKEQQSASGPTQGAAGGSASQDAERTAAMEDALSSRVNLEYRDVHLQDIIDFISEAYLVNFAIDWRVVSPAPNHKPMPRGPHWVTDGIVHSFTVRDMPLMIALNQLLEPLGLNYVVLSNYIFISTPEGTGGTNLKGSIKTLAPAVEETDPIEDSAEAPDAVVDTEVPEGPFDAADTAPTSGDVASETAPTDNPVEFTPIAPVSPKLKQALASEVNMEFEETHVSAILDFLEQAYDTTIDLDMEVVAPAGASAEEVDGGDWVTDGVVDYISIKEVPLADALTSLLRPLGLAYQLQQETIRVSAASC